MQTGVTGYKLNKALIVIASIISLGVQLFVVSPQNVHENMTKLFILLLGLISYLLTLISVRKKREFRFAISYSYVMIVISTFFLVHTKVLYGYTWYQAFVTGCQYYYVVFAPGIVWVLKRSKNKDRMASRFCKIILFFVLVRALSWFFANFTDSGILANFANEYEDWIRSGKVRLIGGSLFGVVFVYYTYLASEGRSIFRSSEKKNKGFFSSSFVAVLFLIAYEALVTASRITTAVMIVVFIMTIYLTRRKRDSRLGIIALVVTSVLLLVIAGAADSIIDSFRLTGTYGASTLARLDGFQHFWELYKTKGRYIGLGFVVDGYSAAAEALFYRTSWLRYYIGDLGIIGAFYRFGVFVFVILGWLYVRSYRATKTMLRKKEPYAGLMLTLTIYLILYSLITNPYDASVAFAMPFYLACISYFGYATDFEREK